MLLNKTTLAEKFNILMCLCVKGHPLTFHSSCAVFVVYIDMSDNKLQKLQEEAEKARRSWRRQDFELALADQAEAERVKRESWAKERGDTAEMYWKSAQKMRRDKFPVDSDGLVGPPPKKPRRCAQPSARVPPSSPPSVPNASLSPASHARVSPNPSAASSVGPFSSTSSPPYLPPSPNYSGGKTDDVIVIQTSFSR